MGTPTLPTAHRGKEEWLKLCFWGSEELLWDSRRHRDTTPLSPGLPSCRQDQQQSGQNSPGLPVTRLLPDSFLQLNTNPKSPARSLACFPWMQKLCLVNLAFQPPQSCTSLQKCLPSVKPVSFTPLFLLSSNFTPLDWNWENSRVL